MLYLDGQWMNVGDVCKALDLSDKTVRRLVKDKKLKAYMIGNSYRFRAEDVHNYILSKVA